MASNGTNVPVTSSGLVAGDNPIHHSLLLFIVQVIIIVCLSRLMAFLLHPLKQPRVVAEILGGILLGPTAFGNIPGFTKNVFPQSSLTVLETIAEVGLIFFLFLVGLELNINKIYKSGVMTVWMAAAGIILPFGLGAIVSYIICKILLVDSVHNIGAFTVFLGVALSITAFPVLARILAERKLLHTEIGQMAISAAAINDVVAWVLLALAIAITNAGSSPLVAVWVLLLGIAFLVLMFLIVSPITYALAHYRELPPEPAVAMTLVLVLGAAFLTDLIGIHVIFGAFICGLIIPKDGPFAAILVAKVEDYVSVLFLPLYFASSGLKTHLSAVNNGTAVLILIMVLATACIGKVAGTFIVAKLWGVENRKAIALGFLMNTKGLVELIVLNIGLQKGVLNQELFAIMVIMALVTTFVTTPAVMWIYSPARDNPPYIRRSIDAGDDKDELRMLLCPFGSWNIYAMMNMVEITRGKDYRSLRAYVLHLIECSERFSTIKRSVFSKRESRDNSMLQGSSELDAIEVAFQTYAQLRKVKVKTAVAVSAYHNMHINVCNTACSNRVNFLLLPFHVRQSCHGGSETINSGLKEVNLKVLRDPPCSVGLLVDNGLGSGTASPPVNCSQHILVLFFGGPDDREALMLARRMLQHGGIKLTVIQFVIQGLDHHRLCSIQKISNSTLMLHSQTQSSAGRGWSALNWLVHEVVDFFKAPWIKTQQCVRYRHSSGSQSNLSSKTAGQMNNADGNKDQDEEEVRIFVENGLSQNERNIDMQALLPILEAATKAKKQEDGSCGDKDVPWNTSQCMQTTNPELMSDIACRNLTLRVVETENLKESVLDILNSAQPNTLVITGQHLHPNSPVRQSCAFTSAEDYGLGPLGDFLVSKQHLQMQVSLLVVKQHSPSQDMVSSPSPHDSNRNLHHVEEEIELGSSISTNPSVDACAPATDKDGYYSDGGYSRSSKNCVITTPHDLKDPPSSP